MSPANQIGIIAGPPSSLVGLIAEHTSRAVQLNGLMMNPGDRSARQNDFSFHIPVGVASIGEPRSPLDQIRGHIRTVAVIGQRHTQLRVVPEYPPPWRDLGEDAGIGLPSRV